MATKRERYGYDTLEHVVHVFAYVRKISKVVQFLLHKDAKEHEINTRDPCAELGLFQQLGYANEKKIALYYDVLQEKEIKIFNKKITFHELISFPLFMYFFKSYPSYELFFSN